jgi:REP element-mobilizing transposase RayT
MPLITNDWREDLYGYLGGIVKNQGGILLAVGGISDHVHLLVGLKASYRLDYFLRELKASSSGWVHREKDPKFNWQNGYGAFAVSATNLDKIKQYILDQEEHHKRKSFQEEYIDILNKSGIEYDERYLW